MRKSVVLAIALAAALIFAPAGAAPRHTATVERGTTFTWQDAPEVNANPYYFRGVGTVTVAGQTLPPESVGPISSGTCDDQPYHACDDILVELSNPLTQEQIDDGVQRVLRSVTISLADLEPAPVSDFDFQIFASDANGTKGPFWTGSANTSQSGNFQVQDPGEELTVTVETTPTNPSQWMLIRVVRFFSPNASYKGTVKF